MNHTLYMDDAVVLCCMNDIIARMIERSRGTCDFDGCDGSRRKDFGWCVYLCFMNVCLVISSPRLVLFVRHDAVGSITYTFNSFRELCAVHKIGGVSISTEVILRCANIAVAKVPRWSLCLMHTTFRSADVCNLTCDSFYFFIFSRRRKNWLICLNT